MDFVSAESQLRNILKDELAYYKLLKTEKKKEPKEEIKEEVKVEEVKIEESKEKEENVEEEKVKELKEKEVKVELKPLIKRFEAIDLTIINVESMDDQDLMNSVEVKYTPRAHPLFKVVQTLLLLAECFSFSMKNEHSIEIFDFSASVYEKLYGTADTVLNSYITQ
jgi:hypothetical protein